MLDLFKAIVEHNLQTALNLSYALVPKRKAKFEGVADVGDSIRCEDFSSTPDKYVIGEVIEKTVDTFKIKVTDDSAYPPDGELGTRVGMSYHVPMELVLVGDWDTRITRVN